MKEINISHISSKRIKTLIHFFNYTFSSVIQPEAVVAEAFIDRYIPEAKEFIFESTGGDLKKLNEIVFISDNEKRIKEKFENEREKVYNTLNQTFDEIITQVEINLEPFKRYSLDNIASNICTTLISIDISIKEDENIFVYIELGQYEEVHKMLNNKITSLACINNSVADYVMDIYRGKKFDSSKHYNITPDVYKYLIYQRNIQNYKDIGKIVGKDNCFLSDVALGFELLIIKHKTDILKVILSLICIYKSYEYEQYMQEYAKLLIDLIQEVMFCGEIFKVYIQMKDFVIDTPVNRRGSDDATTRFSILFSTRNEDIYLLRIELPHKGEEKFHLNLHECIKGKLLPTGYPLEDTDENNKKLLNLLGNKFTNIFFRNDGHIWFKANFEKRLRSLEIKQEIQNELLSLFKYQCHYPIEFNISNQSKYVEFLEELKEYLINFGLEGSVIKSFDKSNLKIEDEILKVRIFQTYIKRILKEAGRTANMSVNGNKCIWDLFKDLGLNTVMEEETFLNCNLSECWKYVDKYIFNIF